MKRRDFIKISATGAAVVAAAACADKAPKSVAPKEPGTMTYRKVAE